MAESVPIIGGIASGISGIMGANEAGNASDAMSQAAQIQAEIAKAQWERYLKSFAPLEDTLIKDSQTPARQTTGYLSNMADLNRNYANLAANTRRNLAGAYPNGSGLALSKMMNLEANRTEGLAGLQSDWNKERFNRMFNTAQLGRGLPSAAMSGLSSAGGMYGNLAQMYGNASNNAFGGLGTFLGNNSMMSTLGGMFNGGGTSGLPSTGGWNPNFSVGNMWDYMPTW